MRVILKVGTVRSGRLHLTSLNSCDESAGLLRLPWFSIGTAFNCSRITCRKQVDRYYPPCLQQSSQPKVKKFLADHRDVTAIATCRRKKFGGHFVGSLTAELEVLLAAAEAGCKIVDLEVESAEEARPAQLAGFRASLRETGAALLVSFHDFTCTKGLNQAAARIEAF